MTQPPTACLVDAHNYIHRAFHGVPAMYSPDGLPTGATYGFARTLLRVVKELQPDYAAALFEGRGSFRRELFADYKANRQAPDDELVEQFDTSRQIADGLGFPCLELDGYEADDLMGTLARRLDAQGIRVIMVSGDKDLAQLVSDQVSLLDVAKNRRLDVEAVTESFGVPPRLIPDLLELIGEQVDNIPGVTGIGPKTAVALLPAAPGIEALLADLDPIDTLQIRGREGVKQRLAASADQLRLSRDLATIRTDAPLDLDAGALRFAGARHTTLDPLFEDLGFGSRIRSEIVRWADPPPATGRRGGGAAKPRRRPIVETGKLDL